MDLNAIPGVQAILQEVEQASKQEITAIIRNEISVMSWEYGMMGTTFIVPDTIFDRFYVNCVGSGLSMSVDFGYYDIEDMIDANLTAVLPDHIDGIDFEQELEMILANVTLRANNALNEALEARMDDIKSCAQAAAVREMTKELSKIAN